MADIGTLQTLLTELNDDVSRSFEIQGSDAFNSYYEFTQTMASPYVRNGFLDKNKASQRFISETAMLHMATTLFEAWALHNKIGQAKNFGSSLKSVRHDTL